MTMMQKLMFDVDFKKLKRFSRELSRKESLGNDARKNVFK